MRPDVLGVIGLGAIGGSVAWAASRRGVTRVLGYTPDTDDGTSAEWTGAVTQRVSSVDRLVAESQFVVLAAPPAITLSLLDEIGPSLRANNTLCTDVTSVKAPVIQRAEGLGLAPVFAGSHPMAGTHMSGFQAADPGMLSDATVFVCSLARGERAAREVADFWSRVCGAHPVEVEAEAHDRALAWSSHLPQAMASALAAALDDSAPAEAAFGRGARDTTRIAASSVEMWRDVLLLNRLAVLEAIEAVEDQLGELGRALRSGDAATLADWLEAGARWRRQLDR